MKSIELNFVAILAIVAGLVIGCGPSPYAGRYVGKGTYDSPGYPSTIEANLDLRPDGKYSLSVVGQPSLKETGSWEVHGTEMKLSAQEGAMSMGMSKDVTILPGGQGLSLKSDTRTINVTFGPKS